MKERMHTHIQDGRVRKDKGDKDKKGGRKGGREEGREERGIGKPCRRTSDMAKRGLEELRSSMRPFRSCSMNSITMNTSSSFLPTTTCHTKR